MTHSATSAQTNRRAGAAWATGSLLLLALTACGNSSVPTAIAATPAPGGVQSSGSSSGASTPTLSAEETQILTAVNAARASAHTCGTVAYAAAAPLSWNPLLAKAALAHSQDMAAASLTYDASNADLMHAGSDGSTPQQRITAVGYTWTSSGENVAAGYEVSGVVDAWLASPGHCKNLMSPNFREIGIGYVYSQTAKYHSYYTQDFGSR
ncbi:CAP domain-containing protein [Deinococcus sp.]|uniref:CAP domain-containing protein n=1 Tax=Deinococcus sp. TaxID=47478 RepID=UPI003CC6C2A0